MTVSKFIPAGRTAIVKRRGVALQVQTEYAARPIPRITTTILDQGRVVQKVERNLDTPIESLNEQDKIESDIKQQHAQVLAIIKDKSSELPLDQIPAAPEDSLHLTVHERLCALPGVERVYPVDNDGNLVGNNSSEPFKKAFGSVFNSIPDILEIFRREPGVGVTREKGVCEIEPNRLYLTSAGAECYFVVIRKRGQAGRNYEKIIKDVIDPYPLPAKPSPAKPS